MRELIKEIVAYPQLTIQGYISILILTDLFFLPASAVCFYGAARYGFCLAVGIIAPSQFFSTTLAFLIGRRLLRPIRAKFGASFGEKLKPEWFSRWQQRSLFKNFKDKLRLHPNLTVFAVLLVAPKGMTGYITGLTTNYPLHKYLLFAALGIIVNVTLKIAWQSSAVKAYLNENITLVLIAVVFAAASFFLARWAKQKLK